MTPLDSPTFELLLALTSINSAYMSTSAGIDIHEEPFIYADETVEAPKWTMNKRTILSSAREFLTDNAGLLLVLLSQAFISMMSAAVKQLSTIDPPVSALQVRIVPVQPFSIST